MFVPRRYDCILLGPIIWDNCIFWCSIGMCILALILIVDYVHSWLNCMPIHSRECPSDYALVSFGPQSEDSRTMSMFGLLSQNDWSKEESIKSKITSNPVHTSCTHLVIISSVHTLQKQHHPAVITLQTSHHPPVRAQLQWVNGETIKVKSSLIEWTPPKQLSSSANLWTLLWKTHQQSF